MNLHHSIPYKSSAKDLPPRTFTVQLAGMSKGISAHQRSPANMVLEQSSISTQLKCAGNALSFLARILT